MKRVLVIGDCIADVYHECTFKKMCPDDPTVEAIVRSHYGKSVHAGGAANVALNIAALVPDAIVDLIGLVPYEIKPVIETVGNGHISTKFASLSYGPTNVKERFIVKGVTKLRVDSPIGYGSDHIVEINLVAYLRDHRPDLIVLSDYDHGAIGAGVIRQLLPYRDRLLVDTKMTDLSVFGSGGDRTKLLKINNAEWSAALLVDPAPERFFEAMIVTKGKNGADIRIHSELPNGRGSMTHWSSVYAVDVPTVDVCGCGDTFLAGVAASLLDVDDPFIAAAFASAAAATVVTQPRTAIANLNETLKILGRNEDATQAEAG